jgi:hypothetical protein
MYRIRFLTRYLHLTNVRKHGYIEGMKGNVLFTIFVVFICNSVLGQEEPTSFYFSDAQPNTKDATAFHENLVGQYVSLKDSTRMVTITEDTIFSQTLILMETTQEKLDTQEKIYVKEGMIYGISEGRKFPVTMKNDTFYFNYVNNAVLFTANEMHKLRILGKNHYLNFKEDNNYWSTLLLNLGDKDTLQLFNLDHNAVMEKVKEFKVMKTEKIDDFKTYIASPSKKEMSRFTKSDGFTDVEKFAKLEEEEQ